MKMWSRGLSREVREDSRHERTEEVIRHLELPDNDESRKIIAGAYEDYWSSDGPFKQALDRLLASGDTFGKNRMHRSLLIKCLIAEIRKAQPRINPGGVAKLLGRKDENLVSTYETEMLGEQKSNGWWQGIAVSVRKGRHERILNEIIQILKETGGKATQPKIPAMLKERLGENVAQSSVSEYFSWIREQQKKGTLLDVPMRLTYEERRAVVLSMISENPETSAGDIHKATGLDGATIKRIIGEQGGWDRIAGGLEKIMRREELPRGFIDGNKAKIFITITAKHGYLPKPVSAPESHYKNKGFLRQISKIEIFAPPIQGIRNKWKLISRRKFFKECEIAKKLLMYYDRKEDKTLMLMDWNAALNSSLYKAYQALAVSLHIGFPWKGIRDVKYLLARDKTPVEMVSLLIRGREKKPVCEIWHSNERGQMHAIKRLGLIEIEKTKKSGRAQVTKLHIKERHYIFLKKHQEIVKAIMEGGTGREALEKINKGVDESVFFMEPKA